MITIPLIDIFAGPGGLGEGFAAYEEGDVCFDIKLSVEKEAAAHRTLFLRKFFRAFEGDSVPDDYYEYVRGEITRDDLLERWPEQANSAREGAWLAELGSPEVPDDKVARKISSALRGHKEDWVLIGGPPCQLYSLAGRSRMDRTTDRFLEDGRHRLYQQYIKILARSGPSVFVMENVPGLLSALLRSERIYHTIIRDLQDPCSAVKSSPRSRRSPRCGYNIYSLTTPKNPTLFQATGLLPRDFIVNCEDYGVPQRRHRIIFLGIRRDRIPGDPDKYTPPLLERWNEEVTVKDVIHGLPRLRSRLSERGDSPRAWVEAITTSFEEHDLTGIPESILSRMKEVLGQLGKYRSRGGNFVRRGARPRKHRSWYVDPRIGGALNHETRSHMRSDLVRYLFLACAAEQGLSLKLRDFPDSLLPRHRNVETAVSDGHGYWSDRFRVQLENQPATTVTSHISKDGHYFIHPDPVQCRTLTVREAARIQTFPDSYFFEGNRTDQYTQVGNAVPPFLAMQIAGIVEKILTGRT